jgi:hypothetical protein
MTDRAEMSGEVHAIRRGIVDVNLTIVLWSQIHPSPSTVCSRYQQEDCKASLATNSGYADELLRFSSDGVNMTREGKTTWL